MRILSQLSFLIDLIVVSSISKPLIASDSDSSNVYSLLQDIGSCIVNFVELEDIVDFSRVAYPSVKTNPKYYLKPSGDNFSTFSIKTRTVTCYISVILMKGTEFICGLPNKNTVRSISSYFKVQHRAVIFITNRFRPGSFQHDFSFNSFIQNILLSPYFFFHYELPRLADPTKRHPADNIDSLTYSSLTRSQSECGPSENFRSNNTNAGPFLPQISSLVAEVRKLTRGWFACTYCSPLEPLLYPFDCPEDGSCYSRAMDSFHKAIDNGKNVLWNVYGEAWNYHPTIYNAIVKHAFSINSVDNKVKTTISFLLDGLNKTLLTQAWYHGGLTSKSKTPTPKIIRRLERVYGHGSVFPLGIGRHFAFITTDGTHEVTDGDQFYLSPFSRNVWYTFVASVCSLFLFFWLLYAKSEGRAFVKSLSRLLTIFFDTSFWSFGLLMEQQFDSAPSRTKDSSVRKASALVFVLWLLSGMVITGLYRGAISASYASEDPFKTKWKTLQEMDNFTLYSSMGKCNNFPKLTFKVSHSSKPSVRNVCHDYPLEGKTKINCKFYNNLHERIYAIEHLESITKKNREALRMLLSMEERLVYTCDDYVTQLILRDLQRPATAFVSSVNDFATYWEIFERQLSRNASKRFAHNKKNPDNFLAEWRGYYFSSLIDDDLMDRRMSALLTSGLYSTWERWGVESRMKKPYRAIARRKDRQKQLKALSLTNSDFSVIFVTHFKYVMACTSMFFCELLLWRYKKRLRMRNAVNAFAAF